MAWRHFSPPTDDYLEEKSIVAKTMSALAASGRM
jgi:hypothetical protein